MKSFLNLGFGDWIISLFDNIPRAIYFFFAAFTSAIDALQCVMRKLAGLDTYYIQSGNEFTAIAARDPLTEFIYGIIGIGQNASVYKALNTVFWSLAIFALIVLALSTMVAMIKSHYSEDYQNTNPWKYIYTAIKAVLSFAIMPIMVVIGLQISSFILKTLDRVTTSNDEGRLTAIYGASVVNGKFKAEEVNGVKVYTHFDFFGASFPTTNSSFGGMLFTAAAYSSNRARTGNITVKQAKNTGIFGDSSSSEFQATGSDVNAQADYIGYQIDFAFANNITLNSGISVAELQGYFPDVRYFPSTDLYGGFGALTLNSFSKYNLTAVWMFYDLWQFNFIIAFGGGVTVIGLLLSIIIGLMSRFIKGAALFLIYPPLVALAPLDNFKAFKSWGTNFMQQVLMAYGAVVGMNILMLILPYVQNISWFGEDFGLIDAIINMLILIVGLLMTKDFITLVSGFVGGADVNSVGAGLKAEVAGAAKKGFNTTVKTGGMAVRGTAAAGRLVGAGAVKIGKAVKHTKDKRALDNMKKNEETLKNAGATEGMRLTKAIENGLKNKDSELGKAGEEARQKALKDGKSEDEANLAAKNAIIEALKAKQVDKLDKDGKVVKDKQGNVVQESLYKQLNREQNKMVKGFKKDSRQAFFNSEDDESWAEWKEKHKVAKAAKQYKRAEKVQEKMASGELKYEKNRWGNYSWTSGNNKQRSKDFGKTLATPFVAAGKGIVKGFDNAFDGKKAGKSLADSFLKGMNGLTEGTGLDKMINGLKGTLSSTFSMKEGVFNPKLEGDALAKKNAEKADTAAQKQAQATAKTNELLAKLLAQEKLSTEATKEVARATNTSNAPRELK